MQVVERGGVKLLVLGFLYNMDDHCANVEVTHVDAAVRLQRQKQVLMERLSVSQGDASHRGLDQTASIIHPSHHPTTQPPDLTT